MGFRIVKYKQAATRRRWRRWYLYAHWKSIDSFHGSAEGIPRILGLSALQEQKKQNVFVARTIIFSERFFVWNQNVNIFLHKRYFAQNVSLRERRIFSECVLTQMISISESFFVCDDFFLIFKRHVNWKENWWFLAAVKRKRKTSELISRIIWTFVTMKRTN